MTTHETRRASVNALSTSTAGFSLPFPANCAAASSHAAAPFRGVGG